MLTQTNYLVFQKERWSYDYFCSEIATVAWILKEDFDVKKSTPVALAMRNLGEMLILIMGIAAAGGIVVVLNAWWTSKALSYALDDIGAKTIFADGTRAERLKLSQSDKGLTLLGVRDSEETPDLAY